MDMHQRCLRLGAAVIVWAVLLRLGPQRLLTPVMNLLNNEKFQAFVLYLETGRIVRFSPSLEENAEFAGESPEPYLPGAAVPVFSRADGEAVQVYNPNGIGADVQALLTLPLEWRLRQETPTVLILHTHTTESYTKGGETYQETSPFRTLDEDYNMLSVGDTVAQILESSGIHVIHDRQLHDYPSYNGAYTHAREALQAYLEKYPSVLLVLDLHRDASGDLEDQVRTCVSVEGQETAQLMLVMGTNYSGWEENLALGLKLHVQAERIAPGVMRPLSLRTQRFNQDLSPGALLIEVGTAGNSHEEAVRAAKILAHAIVSLADGSEVE